MFKVEIRDNCKVCGGALPNARYRTFCSNKCYRKFHNKKYSPRGSELQRARRAKKREEKISTDNLTCTAIDIGV
jgi:predicted nucleic acid-binding Zn ribbon protein